MRIICIILGFLCMGLGAVGVILPILPTTPFLMLSVFFFARSSKKLHDWFLETKWYQRHLRSFVEKRAMTKKTKLSVMATVTVVMGFAFIMMQSVPAARMILVFVWAAHVWYFVFRIKTVGNISTVAKEK